MSDILIKNIGTLKESTPITLYPNGYWKDYTTGESGEFVELLTPHGRLIDVDALTTYPKPIGKLMMFGGEYVYTQTAIDNAPTIIEGEYEK